MKWLTTWKETETHLAQKLVKKMKRVLGQIRATAAWQKLPWSSGKLKCKFKSWVKQYRNFLWFPLVLCFSYTWKLQYKYVVYNRSSWFFSRVSLSPINFIYKLTSIYHKHVPSERSVTEKSAFTVVNGAFSQGYLILSTYLVNKNVICYALFFSIPGVH